MVENFVRQGVRLDTNVKRNQTKEGGIKNSQTSPTRRVNLIESVPRRYLQNVLTFTLHRLLSLFFFFFVSEKRFSVCPVFNFFFPRKGGMRLPPLPHSREKQTSIRILYPGSVPDSVVN